MTSRRTALVTGATSGIGVAVCRRLVAEGLFVYAAARNEALAKEELRDLIDANHVQVVVADLLQDDGARTLIDQCSQNGDDALELIVNNAGGTFGEPRFDERGEVHEAETIYKVNVFAAYALSILGAEKMADGSIVNITSVNGYSPMVGSRIPLYSSSKAALAYMTQTLAARLAPNVRVNAVAPGRTYTKPWGTPSEEKARAITNDALIERWVQPDEIADAVWFLHNNKACTGVELPVDGGIGLKPTLANT